MNFEFSQEEQAFAQEVDQFIEANRDPDVMDVTRENMAQLVDTPKRRAFMKKLSERGWQGMTWPKEYGGSELEGIYEYLLNERLAGVGAPQIGKGVGIIGKTLIRHGSEKLKREFLPQILNAEIEFAGCASSRLGACFSSSLRHESGVARKWSRSTRSVPSLIRYSSWSLTSRIHSFIHSA